MNNQKDTQKTGLNSYGQQSVPDIKTLNNKHVYEFANKKTEKLVTALYMVTDCMDTEDALKSSLRRLGVELLSDMYKLSILSPTDRHNHISNSLAHVYEILSFIEISYTIGFISEMNTSILKKEFLILISELEGHQKKDKHFTFTLDENMFSLPILSSNNFQISNGGEQENYVKNIHNGHGDKRTNLNNMSLTNSKQNISNGQVFRQSNHVASVSEKNDRIDKILSLIKDKKNQTGSDAGVSIKDISSAFTDCSEKTIQRELNSLVEKGKIQKKGAKRWSRYQVIKI